MCAVNQNKDYLLSNGVGTAPPPLPIPPPPLHPSLPPPLLLPPPPPPLLLLENKAEAREHSIKRIHKDAVSGSYKADPKKKAYERNSHLSVSPKNYC